MLKPISTSLRSRLAEDFEAAIEKAYLKARKNIAMPGFRKAARP